MAAHTYEAALQMAEMLTRDEQERLIRELAARAANGASSGPKHSILEIRGLGKHIWEGVDAQEYVNSERASWNG
jgi:hypothetical protein